MDITTKCVCVHSRLHKGLLQLLWDMFLELFKAAWYTAVVDKEKVEHSVNHYFSDWARAFRAALRGLVGQNWVSCVSYAEFNFQHDRRLILGQKCPNTEIFAKNRCILYKFFPGSPGWRATIKKREIWIYFCQIIILINWIIFLIILLFQFDFSILETLRLPVSC